MHILCRRPHRPDSAFFSSTSMPIIDPQDYLPHLILWNVFNTFGAASHTILLVVSILSGNTSNLVLLNLIFGFIIASISSSMMAWSGHALDLHPPFGICLWSGVVAMSDVPLIGGSALSLILRVWGSVMIVGHPAWRGVLEWVIWTPFLLLLPMVSAVALFCVGIAMGINNRSIVYRGGPFYCTVDHTPLQDASLGFGAAYTFLSLFFAAWIVIRLLLTRWRIRRLIDYGGISYPFIIRTLLFSCVVGVAFVVGILSFASTFSAIVPDVVLSSCSVAAFFIFCTSKPILDFVFQCRRVTTTASSVNVTPSTPTSLVTPWQRTVVPIRVAARLRSAQRTMHHGFEKKSE
ncbi:hypothetical protein MIND_01004400 [Mycena indigotica]|uniref:Uncharacterized protein n=1 Tax=Mycena indigotica TaxID=2126181 RepID=A0A8H6VUR6_9AGAR|nr:uncharacterized protein MIND_01004400 [Mycena indigotica]KAF7294674.1 hypothetical protein MIND_01004400 [Mycena indigotica]